MDLRVEQLNQIQEAAPARQAERASAEDFLFTLDRLGKEGLAERLGGLIHEITDVGKRIARHADVSEMRRYRALIKDFINDVVTNSHEFKRENFLDRRGRHRVYGIVRLIDDDLDDLAQELLKQEKDHIAILDKIEEIRGLLLDMIV